jgi:hypothetical protein
MSLKPTVAGTQRIPATGARFKLSPIGGNSLFLLVCQHLV